MFTQPESSLKIYKKRKKALEQKSFLPKELTRLVDFIIKNQLDAAEKASPEKNPRKSLTPSHEVLSGKPLLPREQFPLDYRTSRDLARKILDFMGDGNEHLVQSIEVIQKEMEQDTEFLDRAMQKYLEGDDDFFRTFGEKTPSAPRSLNFVVQSATAPHESGPAPGPYLANRALSCLRQPALYRRAQGKAGVSLSALQFLPHRVPLQADGLPLLRHGKKRFL